MMGLEFVEIYVRTLVSGTVSFLTFLILGMVCEDVEYRGMVLSRLAYLGAKISIIIALVALFILIWKVPV